MNRFKFGLAAILALGAMPAHAMDYDLGSIHIAQPSSQTYPAAAASVAAQIRGSRNLRLAIARISAVQPSWRPLMLVMSATAR